MHISHTNHFKSFLSICTFAFLALAFAPVHADSQGDKHHADAPAKKDGGMMMGDKEHMSKGMCKDMPMMDDLNLTDKQKEAFREAMKQHREAMQGSHELHEQMRTLTHADKYDEKKVRETISKHHKEMEDKMVNASKAMHAFYASLSAEQKTKMDERHKQMKSHMKDHMKDRKKDHGKKDCDLDDAEFEGEEE